MTVHKESESQWRLISKDIFGDADFVAGPTRRMAISTSASPQKSGFCCTKGKPSRVTD